MHYAIQLIVFWGLAFLTLCLALLLLNIYYALIGNELTLRSLGQEAAIAGIASLVEGGSVWVVASFLPAASRALVFPAVIVALIYKLAHLEDWSRYDIMFFLMFQLVIGWSGAFLFFGRFQTAVMILGVFGVVLAIHATIVKSI